MQRKLTAELVGTFILVFGGCGSAVFAAAFVGPNPGNPLGIGLVGVSLAFGLTVLVGVYAFGGISGAHFNPAVSLGLAVAKRFEWRELPYYVGAQLVGAFLAALAILLLVKGDSTLAANGYGDHSPGGYGLAAGLLAEIVLTFIFLIVILGATSSTAPIGFAGLAIGLTLTLVHLIGIPITNLSVNPARSTGPALFVGGWAMGQLWLFWLAPAVGAACAGYLGRWIFADESELDTAERLDAASSVLPDEKPAKPKKAKAAEKPAKAAEKPAKAAEKPAKAKKPAHETPATSKED
jgi:aquaporin Z